ncbi:hypothetical protein MYSTI_06683 [Myxococcus stipitatus DSM 14675]|uniref:Uncharacterized protein n=1 Tax=Myxococcus stipitatus (strain DSM 14675 / JCM 12634 / Mx s8) TaxID=1278073 RepID=L7UG75_MYXSD|nr:hypothetical protein [Myxococcus stipitatus]AGC47956.1 hypothetical protein MYSTI_06683 [Myxococcus stipitatus DSM 14675]
MPQTSFAVFTCDILPAAAPLVRAAIQGVVRAELSKPHRRVRQPLGNQWLVRFDDGGFNSFVLVMSTLRARHPDAFRYLVVGWNDMGSVALYPLGGAAPNTLSLVTAMAAVASGADALAAPLLLGSGPRTGMDFPFQWSEEAGAEEDILGAPAAKARRTGPRKTVTRARAVAVVPVQAPPAPIVEAPVAPPPVEGVSQAPASEDVPAEAAEPRARKTKTGRRKQARGKRAAGSAGAKAKSKRGAREPRVALEAEATQRRSPKAKSKRAGGALSRKRSSATVSAKRSTSSKGARGSAAKAKSAKGPSKRKGKGRAR